MRGPHAPRPAAYPVRRRWRDYATPAGARPVKELIDDLNDQDAEKVAAAMKDARKHGLNVARHLRGPIYEVRASGKDEDYRILFATEGGRGQILLALVALSKRARKTPKRLIELAEQRLRDWRDRGLERRQVRRRL